MEIPLFVRIFLAIMSIICLYLYGIMVFACLTALKNGDLFAFFSFAVFLLIPPVIISRSISAARSHSAKEHTIAQAVFATVFIPIIGILWISFGIWKPKWLKDLDMRIAREKARDAFESLLDQLVLDTHLSLMREEAFIRLLELGTQAGFDTSFLSITLKRVVTGIINGMEYDAGPLREKRNAYAMQIRLLRKRGNIYRFQSKIRALSSELDALNDRIKHIDWRIHEMTRWLEGSPEATETNIHGLFAVMS